MTIGPNSLRLLGGTALFTDGLAEAPIAVSDGFLTEDGQQEIDVSGHFILPGIVDLRCAAWTAMVEDVSDTGVAQAISKCASELARHGVTTAWTSFGWMRGDPLAEPERVETLLSTLPKHKNGPELAFRVEADTHLCETGNRLTQLIEAKRVAHLGLLPLADLLKDVPNAEPGAQSAWSRLRSLPLERQAALRADCLANATAMPRHVCQLAATCDAVGIGFSSLYDRDAEAREYFRMLGAATADAPTTRPAATSARAMDDPVLIEARDVISPSRQQSWVDAGLVSALVSGDTPSAPLRAALALEAQDLMSFAEAWHLISGAPAAIAGYKDRGALVPGKRADLVILDHATGHVAATLVAGRLVAGQGPIADALSSVGLQEIAAE